MGTVGGCEWSFAWNEEELEDGAVLDDEDDAKDGSETLSNASRVRGGSNWEPVKDLDCW